MKRVNLDNITLYENDHVLIDKMFYSTIDTKTHQVCNFFEIIVNEKDENGDIFSSTQIMNLKI